MSQHTVSAGTFGERDIDDLLNKLFPHSYTENKEACQQNLEQQFPDFIAGCLMNKGWSRREFAQRMGVDPSIVHALLSGDTNLIDDPLLEKMSRVLGYETNTLKLILGQDVVPITSRASADMVRASAEEMVDRVTHFLGKITELKYSDQFLHNTSRRKLYYSLLVQLEEILTRHQGEFAAEINILEMFIQELKTWSCPTEEETRKPTVDDIVRIIQCIREEI